MGDYNRLRYRIDHAGITSRDLHGSLGWYRDVLGFRLIRWPIYQGLWSAAALVHRDIFGGSWTGCRIAYLVSEAGIGLELFEFDGPERRSQRCGAVSGVDRGSGTYASHTTANAHIVEAMARVLPGTSDGTSAVAPRASFDHKHRGLSHSFRL